MKTRRIILQKLKKFYREKSVLCSLISAFVNIPVLNNEILDL